jgi:hypothetical protein
VQTSNWPKATSHVQQSRGSFKLLYIAARVAEPLGCVELTCASLRFCMSACSARSLMPEHWSNLDTTELRLLLDEVVGRPGQYEEGHPNRLHLPLGGADARVVLHFKGSRIARITPGPSFDSDQWARLVDEVQTGLISGPRKFARELSFASQPVKGSWKGQLSGVQILPPPRSAPRPPQLMAEHPFILEFPLRECSRWPITNQRRVRLHERLSNLLNVLLTQRVTTTPRRHEQLWAVVPTPKRFMTRWVQRNYTARIGPAVRSKQARRSRTAIGTLDPCSYYSTVGSDGEGLRLPADLDTQIMYYTSLPAVLQERFDRAAYWMSMASRQWTISMSLSLTALVSAVEALTERGTRHEHHCADCDKVVSHDSPGATERFRSFLSRYA